MAEISNLAERVAGWLSGTGPQSDIVMSSRVRLARNLTGFPFLKQATEAQQKQIEELASSAITKGPVAKDIDYFSLDGSPAMDKLFLVERHLISKEHAGASGGRGVAYTPSENVAIMINEEDHLRIQVLRSGLELTEAWKEINEVDDKLGEVLNFAFSTQFGYLTACPTNVGTGIRVSVMLHLPALVMTKQIEKVYHAMAKINLAVRGFYGERTQALGDFYQISNQVTLGKNEESIVDSLLSVVPQVITYEEKVRQTLLVENRHNLDDRIWRAYGTLKYARTISSEEAMNLLSSVRMGINMGLIKDIPLSTLNALFLQTQPAHLQKMEKAVLSPAKRDVARAKFIRESIASTGGKTTKGRKRKQK